MTTLAGSAGQSGSTDGIGSLARFEDPIGVAVDSGGNVYVADGYSSTIRRITPAAADAILQSVGRSVRSFQEEMDRQLAARSADTGAELRMEMVARRHDATASSSFF